MTDDLILHWTSHRAAVEMSRVNLPEHTITNITSVDCTPSTPCKYSNLFRFPCYKLDGYMLSCLLVYQSSYLPVSNLLHSNSRYLFLFFFPMSGFFQFFIFQFLVYVLKKTISRIAIKAVCSHCQSFFVFSLLCSRSLYIFLFVSYFSIFSFPFFTTLIIHIGRHYRYCLWY